MPYVYILECADGSYYTGSTWDLDRRLWEHQNGLGAKHTSKRLPVKLVFCEECDRVEDAYAREKQIQGWSRKKKQALMAGDWDRVHQLAECRNRSNSRNLGFDSAQPTLLGHAQPASLGNSQPASLGNSQPTSLGSAAGDASEQPGWPAPTADDSSAGCSPPSPKSRSTSVPRSHSAAIAGTEAERGAEEGRALSRSTTLTGTGAKEGRALSEVEGNASSTTESCVIPNHED